MKTHATYRKPAISHVAALISHSVAHDISSGSPASERTGTDLNEFGKLRTLHTAYRQDTKHDSTSRYNAQKGSRTKYVGSLVACLSRAELVEDACKRGLLLALPPRERVD